MKEAVHILGIHTWTLKLGCISMGPTYQYSSHKLANMLAGKL